MEKEVHGRTLKEIAEELGGRLSGDGSIVIQRAVAAGSEDPHGIAFAESAAYLQKCLHSKVGAVIAIESAEVGDKPAVLVQNPRLAFVRLLGTYVRPLSLAPGIHPTAVVSDRADVSPSASIGAYAVIEDGAKVGDGCSVFPFCYVGQDCTVGDGTVLMPHSVLYQGVKLGKGCTVHAGSVIGADGFGFFWDGTKQHKVPQVGGVAIGDGVELGALTCVDRATCGETVVGDGVKIDNLVQVGHNVEIGDHTVIAASSAIGGSCKIGKRAMLGGQVAVADHVTIGDGVAFGGRSGVFQDVEEPGQYLGLPPLPIAVALRQMAAAQRMPEALKRLKALEDEVRRLKGDG